MAKSTQTVQNSVNQEPTYSIDEIARAAQTKFGVMPEVAKVALITAGKKKATLSEAEQIISKFQKREVK
ncbi:MAG: hypothetical protein LBT88_01250 [Oscillospiraceae bacterium]|jgi:hypothetical protein|nr:hypothetical protein [Oscillospiraceae bacterium]